jgi:lipopolysaccharide biosynthesis glycosyltransferase
MNILINVDNNYIERAKDTLLSIHFHNKEKLNIYLIYDEIDDNKISDFKQYITNTIKGNLKIIKYDLDNIDFPIYSDYISKSTYYRLFFPFLLDEKIDRILYLDCDIICTNSIKELYETDFEGNLFVACENMTVTERNWFNYECNERLELPYDNKYVNAGVLLINIEKYKKEVNKDELIKFINDNSDKLLLQDQDVINKFFYKKIKLIDNKYNYQINGVDYGMERTDYVLVHYSESHKPWDYDYILINKLKPYYEFLWRKGDTKTLEKLIQYHIDNYRKFLLRCYCNWKV